MAVLNAANPPKVTVGRPVKLGSITAATDQFQFSISENSGYHLGSLIFQIVPQPAGGTITALTTNIAISLDGGTTFDPQTGNVGASTVASSTGALDFHTNHCQNVAMPGVGGQISLRWNTQTLTFGTATSVDLWVLLA